MNVLGRRWDFLRPWCAPVRGALVLQRSDKQTHVPPMPYKAIEVQLPYTQEEPPTPADLRPLRDALVLLALVAHVDFSAWKYVLSTHCDLSLDDHGSLTDEEDFRKARFMLCPNIADPWAVLHGLFADLDALPSANFVVAARKVASYRICCESKLGALEIPVFVHVETLAVGTTYHVERTYRALRALQARHGGRRLPVNVSPLDQDGSSFDCAFVIEPLDIEMTGYNLTPEMVQLVEEMVGMTDELPLRRLAVMPPEEDELDMDSARGAQIFGKMYTRMLCASGSPGEKLSSIGEADFDLMHGHNPAPMARFSSALAETQTTDTLTMSLEEALQDISEARAQIWAFVAYALFSEHAREHSSIRHVCLSNVWLTSEHAEAFAAVLASADPVERLFGHQQAVGSDPDSNEGPTPNPSGCPRTRWMLCRGTTVALQKMHALDAIPAESASWELASDVVGVQLLGSGESEDEGTVSVLVPGYGACKVARDALRIVEEGDKGRGTGGVTSLDLAIVKLVGDGDALYQLLEAAGSTLTRLRLGVNVESASRNYELDVGRVLRSCPHLTALVIDGVEVNAVAFLDAIRSEKAHIEELNCRFDDLAVITEELSDKTTPLARTLKRLMSSSFNSRARTAEWQMVTVPLMLDANRVLEYVELMAPRDICNQFAMSLQRSHNAPLPVACEPFPLQTRLAFLSIFAASRRCIENEGKRAKQASSSVSSGLANFPVDRYVMSIIFGFAAERVRRRVYLDPW